MDRAVGYCDDTDCDEYAKGAFLLNHGNIWHCPRCRGIGSVVPETGISKPVDGRPFKEVRVEFNYDPVNHRFRDIGIVRDEAIWGTGGTYTLITPLIKTEKRALKVAEAVLANLQRYADTLEDGIPRTTETVLSLDDDADRFTANLELLGQEWENSALAQQKHHIQPED